MTRLSKLLDIGVEYPESAACACVWCRGVHPLPRVWCLGVHPLPPGVRALLARVLAAQAPSCKIIYVTITLPLLRPLRSLVIALSLRFGSWPIFFLTSRVSPAETAWPQMKLQLACALTQRSPCGRSYPMDPVPGRNEVNGPRLTSPSAHLARSEGSSRSVQQGARSSLCVYTHLYTRTRTESLKHSLFHKSIFPSTWPAPTQTFDVVSPTLGGTDEQSVQKEWAWAAARCTSVSPEVLQHTSGYRCIRPHIQ